MSHSQQFSDYNHNNYDKADDSSTVFDADTVMSDEVPSLPPASKEESPANTISELLRRINSHHRPAEPSATTATATVIRNEEFSCSNQHQSLSSSSSKKRPIVGNRSVKRKQLQENSNSTTTKKSSTKRPRRSSGLKRQSQDQNCIDDKSDEEVEDKNEFEEAVINQSSSSSSSQTSTKRKLTKHELKWKSKFQKLHAYKRSNGNVNVPTSNKELHNWVDNQRREYRKLKDNKHSCMTNERIEMLESIGFEWLGPKNESRWNKRFIELKEYKEKFGDTKVPKRWEDNKQLGTWVNTQRTEYKKFQANRKSFMVSRRIEMLNSIGFEWVAQNDESSWNKRFTELKDYKEKNDHTNVPKRWEVNKVLGVWVHNQRRHYKNFQANKKSPITLERIDLLNSIGFQWECRPARAPRS